MKSLVFFIGGALLFGAAGLGIAYALEGDGGLLQAGVAFALAFVPAAITLGWVIFSYRTAPEMQLLACLGGSGLRLAITLGGGMILAKYRPETFQLTFWCWLLVFYLTFLAYEITLVIWRQPKETSRDN